MKQKNEKADISLKEELSHLWFFFPVSDLGEVPPWNDEWCEIRQKVYTFTAAVLDLLSNQ